MAEEAICPGFVQSHPDGYPLCTDGVGGFLAWQEVEYTNFWSPELSIADANALLLAVLGGLAMAFTFRLIFRVITNRL